jgi:hypothetical protein
MALFGVRDFMICCVCHGETHQIGIHYDEYNRRNKEWDRHIFWCCEECGPQRAEKYAMTKVNTPAIAENNEAHAIREGGRAAGQYLMQTGKFDMRAMTPEEWETFLTTFLAAYEATIREKYG